MQTKLEPAVNAAQRGLSTFSAVLVSLGITFATVTVIGLALNFLFQAL